jgi:quinol monooxygenase YgiN
LIIVTGIFEVRPDQRERFMSSKSQQVANTRGEKGCREYAFSADAEQPDLVRLFELWESMDDLNAHLQGLRSSPMPAQASEPAVEVTASTFALFEGAAIPAPWEKKG